MEGAHDNHFRHSRIVIIGRISAYLYQCFVQRHALAKTAVFHRIASLWPLWMVPTASPSCRAPVAHAFWACDRAQEVWETVKAAARAPALSARAVFHLVPPSPSRFTQYSWAVTVGAAFKLIWRRRQELWENWRSPSTPAGLYAQLGAIVAAEVQDTLAVTGAGRLAALLGKRGDRLVLAHANGRRFSWRGFPAAA